MTRRGQGALVTGSSGGIGRAIALKLAAEGFDVAIHYLTSKEKAEQTAEDLRALGVKCVALQANLSRPEEAEKLVQEAHQHLGNLSVLVNNVGNYVFKPLLDNTLEDWHDMLDSNLNSTFYTCRTAIPIMREQQHGRIINLGYAGAENVLARPGNTAYAIAKTGVIILSKSLARTEIKHGITVNVVSPGIIETSVTKPLSEVPAGRDGKLEELVYAVWAFVDGPEYITGQVLEVSGGWNL
ncbi:bifunctional dihydropteridine reductase/dihydrofolate reductase TmpR [Deinococcus roseus]|uniref:Bifunctional dihydropteridine reductase/dihydrofolate reductase TmpR n=1 Tax=Deinococcus roseus TaxID=392414 RepID=A0ABQ2D786_9DEIO|nr:bifunctional dihydropteridine reductase/dihydrofolate reductase TmpR [Deinococcus roseus]GGJ48603.1 bifunctional dihydropteridine reductase/dihydrofolate reductase TmpR [Deinococcus roseus]